MQKTMLLILIALTVSSFVLNKKIDATNSTISFLFESKKVKGTIGDIQSSSSIDLDNFENSSLEGSVAITTLKTGNFLRDGHLMWEKYFYRKKYPRLYFKSETITKKANNEYVVVGELTVKGIRKVETFNVLLKNAQLKVTGTINTADYGVVIEKQKEKNTVTVEMNFEIN